jgi:hypothetical protein
MRSHLSIVSLMQHDGHRSDEAFVDFSGRRETGSGVAFALALLPVSIRLPARFQAHPFLQDVERNRARIRNVVTRNQENSNRKRHVMRYVIPSRRPPITTGRCNTVRSHFGVRMRFMGNQLVR